MLRTAAYQSSHWSGDSSCWILGSSMVELVVFHGFIVGFREGFIVKFMEIKMLNCQINYFANLENSSSYGKGQIWNFW